MNNKIKKILPQILTLLFVILIFGFFTFNAQVNMDNRGIDFGFGFLKQEASFDIQFSLVEYDGLDPYWWAYVAALLNTLLVASLGIILCTILGVIVEQLITMLPAFNFFAAPLGPIRLRPVLRVSCLCRVPALVVAHQSTPRR